MKRSVFAVPAAVVVFAALTAHNPCPRTTHSLQPSTRTRSSRSRAVITQVKLANPHSWIYLDVKDAKRQRRAVGVRSTDADSAHSQRGKT
jgi:hypothetical protein